MKKAILIGLFSGIIGVALSLFIYHIYTDHKVWHQLLNNIAQQQQQKSNAQVPNK
jgi:hypothetical protein